MGIRLASLKVAVSKTISAPPSAPCSYRLAAGELVEELAQTCLAEPDADGGEARTQRSRWCYTCAYI